MKQAYINKMAILKRLHDSFSAKEKLNASKMHRARTMEKVDFYSEKRKLYSDLCFRAMELAFALRKRYCSDKKISASVDSDMIRCEYEVRLERKARGRQDYLNKHRYTPWFIQTSLGADYGTFVCDRCGGTFYHSPSTITLADKTVHKCCCGHCTNTIINRDWHEEPYF